MIINKIIFLMGINLVYGKNPKSIAVDIFFNKNNIFLLTFSIIENILGLKIMSNIENGGCNLAKS